MFMYARSIPRPAAARNEAYHHQLRIPLFVFYTGKFTASYFGAIQVRLQPTHEQYLSTDNLKEKVELTSSKHPCACPQTKNNSKERDKQKGSFCVQPLLDLSTALHLASSDQVATKALRRDYWDGTAVTGVFAGGEIFGWKCGATFSDE